MLKRLTVVLLVLVLVSSCRSRAREEELRKKEAALNQKERELLVKEKTLELKEEELLSLAHKIDSTKATNDSTMPYNPAITGLWDVSMNCIEASCPGSTVGDSKTEKWDIFYQDNHIICKAMTRNRITRVYSGEYNGNNIQLADEHDSTSNTQILVWLRMANDKLMEGQREIIREGGCKIVYALELSRK